MRSRRARQRRQLPRLVVVLPVFILLVVAATALGCGDRNQVAADDPVGKREKMDPAAGPAGRLLWSGDFDGGDLGQWPTVLRRSPDRLTRVTSRVREGGYAARFTAYDGDLPDNPRAQLNGPLIHRQGDEQYIGWSTYFPRQFPAIPSGGWFVFFQFHSPLQRLPPVGLWCGT